MHDDEARPLEPREALATYADHLEAGRFREAADVLEAAWQRHRGELAKAFIKVAVALYQDRRGKRRGAVKLLAGALAILERYPTGAPAGIDGREGWPQPAAEERARARLAVAASLRSLTGGGPIPAEALAEVIALARTWGC